MKLQIFLIVALVAMCSAFASKRWQKRVGDLQPEKPEARPEDVHEPHEETEYKGEHENGHEGGEHRGFAACVVEYIMAAHYAAESEKHVAKPQENVKDGPDEDLLKRLYGGGSRPGDKGEGPRPEGQEGGPRPEGQEEPRPEGQGPRPEGEGEGEEDLENLKNQEEQDRDEYFFVAWAVRACSRKCEASRRHEENGDADVAPGDGDKAGGGHLPDGSAHKRKYHKRHYHARLRK